MEIEWYNSAIGGKGMQFLQHQPDLALALGGAIITLLVATVIYGLNSLAPTDSKLSQDRLTHPLFMVGSSLSLS